MINKLEELSFKWVNQNYMKVNSDKSQLSVLGTKKAIANINNYSIEFEDVHELHGITIDLNLTLENHINKL